MIDDQSLPVNPAPAIYVNTDNLPAELKSHAQWFPWRWVWRHDRWNKVPVWFDRNAKTGRPETWHIPSNSPATWHEFEEVARLVGTVQKAPAPWLGIAFRFAPANPFAFIDLDKCIDTATGVIDPWALSVIRRFDSYTEITQSGRGIRIIIRGEKPGTRCRTTTAGGHQVEVYDKTQFSALTGRRLDLFGLSMAVNDRQGQLAGFYQELFPGDAAGSAANNKDGGPLPPVPPADRSDSWIIARLETKPYWHGPNKSEQDQQLANRIAYYCGQDPARIERIMMQAPARRSKWRRKDYIRGTIEEALAWCFRRAWFYEHDLAKWQEQQDQRREKIGPINEADLVGLFAAGKEAKVRRLVGEATKTDLAVLDNQQRLNEAIESLSRPKSQHEAAEDAREADAARTAHRLATHPDRPPPLARCGCLECMAHEGKRKLGAFRVLCKRWKCLACAKKLKTKWAAHLHKKILEEPGPMYLADVPSDYRTTRRITRHLQRHDGRYARIEAGDGRQLIVSTIPLGKQDQHNQQAVSPVDAAAAVARAIGAIPIYGDTRKPVHACRDWKLPPRNESGWKRLGALPADMNRGQVAAHLEAETGREAAGTGGGNDPFVAWAVQCDFQPPPDPDGESTWMDKARAAYERINGRAMGFPEGAASAMTDADARTIIDQLFGVAW